MILSFSHDFEIDTTQQLVILKLIGTIRAWKIWVVQIHVWYSFEVACPLHTRLMAILSIGNPCERIKCVFPKAETSTYRPMPLCPLMFGFLYVNMILGEYGDWWIYARFHYDTQIPFSFSNPTTQQTTTVS